MMKLPHQTFGTTLILIAVAGCLAAGGCAPTPTARVSHPPTYSYVHDPVAAAEVASWPDMQASAPVPQVASGLE